ncbi:MAG: M24 family metallopeptidase [Kofleriaceae bacterium]|nr:M24 family metallopeptidase [Kofleriaceae bacterium]
MKRMRTLTCIGLAVSLLSSVAMAEPKDGSKGGVSTAPLDPYATPRPAQPDDPYADPAPPLAPAKPVAGKPPAKSKPTDPNMVPGAEAAPPPLPAKQPLPKLKPTGATPPMVPTPAKSDPVDPYAPVPVALPEITPRVAISDLGQLQGLLAVQRLDGWLLLDRDGNNPIAARVVKPEGNPSRPWFYLVPAKGEPIALAHAAELRSFDHLAGKKLAYTSYTDLDKQLKAMLKGVRTVAVEYSAKASVPSVSRIDAGMFERVKATGVQVKSSQNLLQLTKAVWGEPGRTAHFVAVHHLTELRKDALAYVTKAIQAGQTVTEYDVQQRLVRNMTIRGLASVAPVVAAGANTGDPYYVPNAAKAAPIKRGDLLVISLALKVDKPEGVWAAQTWVAMVDATVPEPIANAFAAVVQARDRAITLMTERTQRRRPLTGAEVDAAARSVLQKAGFLDKALHRTGHSIDNDFQGAGADLDSFEVKDTRILTTGTGVTVGPGIYFGGQFGVRSEVSVYLAGSGPEVTTPKQDAIQPLLGR